MVLPKSQRTCPYAYKPGVVDLAFIVEPDGSVSHIKILSENPRNCGYASDAIFAFRYWKFPPHMENGVAVAYPGTYTVNFDPLGLPAEPVK
jgi:TonB family protein